VYRNTVDEVTSYIVGLLDESAEVLPSLIENTTEELGRITKPIALSVKAKLLIMVASPLFNGNTNYASVVDNRGVSLFPQQYDATKWDRAATALKEAIDCAETEGNSHLYTYDNSVSTLSQHTKQKLNIRGSVTERWNPEIIWGTTEASALLQKSVAHRPVGLNVVSSHVASVGNPTIRSVERFYSKNGVPISEDLTWDYVNRYDLRVGGADHRFLIREGYTTAKL